MTLSEIQKIKLRKRDKEYLELDNKTEKTFIIFTAYQKYQWNFYELIKLYGELKWQKKE